MTEPMYDRNIYVPMYKSRHVPRLSLLPFEIDAPGSQLSPPLMPQYDEHFTPKGSPALSTAEGFMMEGYFGSTQARELQPTHRRKKSNNSKKVTPNDQRFPEFVPHHSRGNSSTSTWNKSSTSSATLAVAESKTVLIYPPRKASQVTIEHAPRKDSDTMAKFTGDNREKKNYSMPRITSDDYFDSHASTAWIPAEHFVPFDDHMGRGRQASLAQLIPSPLEMSRKPSLGSLKTPLAIPGEDLATMKIPSPAQLSRKPSWLSIPFDEPRKDSSTLPWGVEEMTPSMIQSLQDPFDKYKSQMIGNPFKTPERVPSPSPSCDESKFDIDSWPLPQPGGRKSKVDRHSFLKLKLRSLDMADTASIYTARKDPKPYSYFLEEPESKYKKVKRVSESCWGRWSTRQIILAITGVILFILLAAGVSLGIIFSQKKSQGPGLTPTWRPAIGNTWQIELGKLTNPTLRAQVYNIDLFDNNASTIAGLHNMGRRVICYFSAGTLENWRPDSNKFDNLTFGKSFQNWPNETWLDTRSQSVRDLMGARIQLAKNNGCDGVDPDNVDGYLLTSTDGTGFPLTETTSAEYVRWLANFAHHLDIAIGLKNSFELINRTLDVLDWQLNEGCARDGNCEKFQPFIQAGKPVFHIEYANNGSAPVLEMACTANGTSHFSTLIKRTQLDFWTVECPYGDPAFGAD